MDAPIITFRTKATADATPKEVYEVLADLSTHLEWAGTEGREGFRIRTLDGPSGLATKGTSFASTGDNGKHSCDFQDRSVVTDATPGRRFAFETESTLPRKHRPTWHARFVHNYVLRQNAGGTQIDYTCEVFPQNYRPYWLHPLIRPATRTMVTKFITKHLENLARASERAKRA